MPKLSKIIVVNTLVIASVLAINLNISAQAQTQVNPDPQEDKIALNFDSNLSTPEFNGIYKVILVGFLGALLFSFTDN